MRNTLRRLLAAQDVDDAMQESLMALVESLGRFRGESSVSQFARGVARRHGLNLLRDAYREERRRMRASLVDLPRVVPPGAPHEEAVRFRRREALRGLLESLPPAQAEAVTLRFVDDSPLRQIAHLTRAPVNTVRTRLRLGLRALRQRVLTEPALAELLREQS
jgi:RNA polymerase sigma-70 factor (ECF subfamily)